MGYRVFLIFLSLVLVGCTPEAYRTSADLQVNRILSDRKQTTLDYKPETTIATPKDSDTIPGKPAYTKIPTTPVPPKTPWGLEPVDERIHYGPLGPENLWPGMSPPQQGDLYGIEEARRRTLDELKLGPPAPHEPPLRFDLYRSLAYAVQHSRNYQTQLESLYLAALDVTTQRHLFEPRPFVTQSLLYTGGQMTVDYNAALTAATTAGVRQRLPYGGEIVAQSLVQFVQAIDGNVADGESASVALSGTIPLLRGAGMVNLEPLIESERTVIYQVRAFEDFRRSFGVDICTRYFSLLTLQESLANRRINYASLSSLTQQTRALYAAGRINFLEVQRSLQAQLTAENQLVLAREAYDSSLDQFKIVLGMPIDEDMEIIPIELELRLPNIEMGEAVRLATRYRLDLQTASDRIDDARRAVDVAKNGLQPDLNLIASATAANDLGHPAVKLDSRTLTYTAGATLDLPVDRVVERNAYRASLISLQQSQRAYEELRDGVAVAARDALRRIQAAQVSLRIQAAGIDLARRRLDNSLELLKQGKIESRDVVESQASLLQAQDDFDLARATMQIEVLNFLRDTGTLRVDPQAGFIGRALERESKENIRTSG